MTEQVYQCAKVSRSSSPPEDCYEQQSSLSEGKCRAESNISTKNIEQPASQKQDCQTQEAGVPAQEKLQNTRDRDADKASVKTNVFATIKSFMELGIYMCGSEKENQAQQTKPMASKPLNQEEKMEENSAIEVPEGERCIFEDLRSTGSEEERDATPKCDPARKKVDTNNLPSQLRPGDDDDQKREPAKTKSTTTTKRNNDDTRTQDDISDLTECCKDDQSQSLESLDFHMMGDFDMVETDFFGTKKISGTEPPRLAAAGYSTRFEI